MARQRKNYDEALLDVAGADQGLYEDFFADQGSARGAGFLSWRYAENPSAQQSVVNIAKEVGTNDIAALYAVMGASFQLNGTAIAATQSLDTLTHKEHRGQGLFPRLATANYEIAKENGATLVYGFPNAASGPVFEKKLGWTLFGEIPFLFRPMRSGFLISKILRKLKIPVSKQFLDFPLFRPKANWKSGLEITKTTTFSAEHTQIWTAYSEGVKIALKRDATYLNWRVFARPDGAKYKAATCYAGGQAEGYVIWCCEQKHGANTGYIIECLARPDAPQNTYQALMTAALNDLHSQKADIVLAWVPPHQANNSGFRAAGFKDLPSRLRPIRLFWGGRFFDNSAAAVGKSQQDWYISYLDSDTV